MDVNGLRTAVDVGCVVTRDSDLHGTGLFATEALEAGTEILADTPLADFQLPESSERPLDDIVDHIRNLPNDAVRELYPIAQKFSATFEQMSESHFVEVIKNPGLETVKALVHDILHAFIPYASARTDGWGFLCDRANKLNRSYRPNAEACWDHERQLVVVRVTRAIKEDEEITPSYIDEVCCRLKRWERLGFKCQCQECHLSGEHFTVSELIRANAKAFDEAVLALRRRYGMHTKEVWIVTHAEALRIANDRDAQELKGKPTICLPPNTYHRSFLAVATDAVAAIHTANAMTDPDHATRGRMDAIEVKLTEREMLKRCKNDSVRTA